MNLRRNFVTAAITFSALLLLIGGMTWAALNALSKANAADAHRQRSLALMNEVRHEVDLLGRLVHSYVSTAEPRYLHYYYDILAIREGTKPYPEGISSTFWDEVIAQSRPYRLPPGGKAFPLIDRAKALGFEAQEQAVVSDILALTEQMKSVEQIAFAATQGLYDPELDDFVSETQAQPEFAKALLHRADYLKLGASMAIAVQALSDQVDKRTQQRVAEAASLLEHLIRIALLALVISFVWLIYTYRTLNRNLLAPLMAVHTTAQQLAQHAYGQRVGHLEGAEEIRTLGATIDSMAEAIEADIAQREAVQIELNEARQRAEVATAAKSSFLANMSHEIRTPMNAILGMAYLALRSDLTLRQRDQISKIHGAASALLGIINDILDFSKIEAGKIKLEQTPFDLQAVIRNVLSVTQQRAGEKQLELIAACPLACQASSFIGDPLRLGQILINLLSNAVKFTDQGHVALYITHISHPQPSQTLRFCIEDTGIGMTAEQISRLFEDFSQADSATTRRYGGTGLGLSISKRLVEAMGGQIEVESTVDRGSRFSFSLQLPMTKAPAIQHAGQPLRAHRALVVDDYAPALESTASLLRQLGCAEVEAVDSGAAAIRQLQSAAQHGPAFTLLLLDWAMPGIDGKQVLHSLRDSAVALPARVIVMSTRDPSLLRDEVACFGLSEIRQKPLLPELLLAAQHPALADSPIITAKPEPASHASPLAGARILIVDDNPTNLEIAEALLQDWGAHTERASHGALALERVMANAPAYFSAVLMDIEMPIMDGYQATRQLRADPRYAQLPILATTAHAMGQEIDKALAEGMNGHIAKPLVPDQLLSTLLKHLKRSAPSRPTTSATITRADDLPAAIGAIGAIGAMSTIPGLDMQALGARFKGRGALLLRLLKDFAAEHQDFCQRLSQMLMQNDLAAAKRQIHSLKGLSATFGLPPLQHKVIAAEQALNQDGTIPADLLQTLDHTLHTIVEAIKQTPDGDEPRSMASPITPPGALQLPEIQNILADLQYHLNSADGEVESLWRNHKSRLGSVLSKAALADIDHAITHWDFDQALAILRRSTAKTESKS